MHGPREIARLARGVTGFAAWFGQPLDAVLDVGAGPGLWRDWFRRHSPRTRYLSTDVSPYACSTYGHERRDITRWRARQRFDLIVCQGVLQYLDDREAERAIANLAAMAGGLLYLEATTRGDLAHACDPRTDGAIHARSAAWYRRLLAPHFRTLGCGLYYARRGPLVFYDLEAGA